MRFFSGRPFLGAALFVVAFVLVVAPVGEALLQRGGDPGEVGEEVVAELVMERRADVLVAGGKAQAFDGLQRELAVQAQRALDGDLPVAEGGVGEDLRLRRLLELEKACG